MGIIFQRNAPIRCLFYFQAAFSMIFCFINVFMNVFLWDKGLAFTGIGCFNLFSVSSIFLFSLLGAYLLKFWGTRATFFCSSILALILFAFLLRYADSLPGMLPLLGTLYGGYVGLFYVAFNVMLIWLSHDAKRNFYIGLESTIATVAQLLTPIGSGLLIVHYGYTQVFAIILFLVIFQVVICLRIPAIRTNGSYRKRGFFFPENTEMLQIGLSSAAYGFYFAFIQMSYGLFIYFTIENEFHLGSWNFIFGLISSFMYWWVGKLLNQSNKDLFLSMGMTASVVVTLGLLLSEPAWFIVFNLVVSASLPLLWIPAKAIHFSSIKKQSSIKSKSSPHLGKMVQLLVFRELSISLGRIVFFLITVLGFELGIGTPYYSMVMIAVLMPLGIWILNRHSTSG